LPDVETVWGAISPEDLGITMMHEHTLCDLRCSAKEPAEASMKKLFESPVTIEVLGALRRDPTRCKDNLVLTDEALVVDELMWFKKWGGRSIVDLTLPGVGRDPYAQRRISAATGLNIIAATGWYTEPSFPDSIKEKSVEELCDIMVKELLEGIDETGVKAGVIGECGCSRVPYHLLEKKVLQAAARAQAKTGSAYTIHPALIDVEKRIGSVKVAETYLDLIEKEGADLSKFYLSHADRTCIDLDYHRRLLDRGITLGYDCLGKGVFFDSAFIGAGGRSDGERVRALVELCAEGYDRQLLLSQDVCFKTNLRRYGGMGYAHILENIVPTLRGEGVSQEQIRNMLVENPKRLLAR
jgi:phosphotriesterase-related protein